MKRKLLLLKIGLFCSIVGELFLISVGLTKMNNALNLTIGLGAFALLPISTSLLINLSEHKPSRKRLMHTGVWVIWLLVAVGVLLTAYILTQALSSIIW